MDETQSAAAGTPKRLYIGMTFDEVCCVLGPPDDTNSGADMFGAGTVLLSSVNPAAARSRLSATKFCAWRRAEGMYLLAFEHEMLTKAASAPEGAVADSRVEDSGPPARLVWIATNGEGKYPREIVDRMVRQKQLRVTPDVLIEDIVDPTAAKMQSQEIAARLFGASLRLAKDKPKNFLDMESIRIVRFKDPQHPTCEGVLVTVAGPKSDPSAALRLEVEAEGRRDVCTNCGTTWEERLREWNAPVAPGVVKIGDEGGAFMFCPRCKVGVCGRCSVDLGMTAGCPRCKAELVHMDGSPQ